MARSPDKLPRPDPDGRVIMVKALLDSKGVRDFEPVSLFCGHLTTGQEAVLKPAQTAHRVQNQHFALGDRVTMVQDSGGIPLSVKGIVIGPNSKTISVMLDVPFTFGSMTLGDLCIDFPSFVFA
ncbi:uncharacterized protein LACBIDRAFT_298637 [Laccaria bicolor S238N-H82]|uniref:Predicted protein n=1 Tax=Laccaria bicolor (strain S238N-H82 / ATCC MYA-4686) TaxID=486041 RepID=B0DD99_LACBS|nr:uncharacterized protein LACBIDRAFT_298637 [Laccaria bicolor S238N-H82]EDR07439.1 predicted protein [Laccaria bicolor S238N-H82]|eukprot:XP_001881831.1 predicted protein [Laccaria bicolor S238N-H82]